MTKNNTIEVVLLYMLFKLKSISLHHLFFKSFNFNFNLKLLSAGFPFYEL